MKLTIAIILLSAPAMAGSFTLDAQRSELLVKTTRDGIAKGLAHDHVVVARDVEGTFSWDDRAPEEAKISVVVKVGSLVADEPALRARFGLTKPLGEKDRRKVTDAMLDEGQLDAKRFPTISFESTGVRRDGERFVVSGNFTLHGVTRKISVPVEVTRREGTLTGAASFQLRTSDFGIKPYSAALGTIKNRDEVDFKLRLVAVPR